MKSIAKAGLAVAISALTITTATAASAAPENTCLQTYYIARTRVVDAKTILFRMKDGALWRNSLRTPCNGLLFSGFVYSLHGTEICSGDNQPITVLRSHEVCQLGQFTRLAPTHA